MNSEEIADMEERDPGFREDMQARRQFEVDLAVHYQSRLENGTSDPTIS